MSADIHGLVGAYAVDAIDEQERSAFELHLAECPECQAEVASLQEAATQLSLMSEVAAPASMRDSVLAGIKTVRPLPPLEAQSGGPVASGPVGGPSPTVDAPTRTGSASHAVPDSTVVPFRPRRRVTAWLASAAAAAVLLVGGLAWSPWDDGTPPPRNVSAIEKVLEAKDAKRYEKVIGGAKATIVRSASLGKAVIIADHMPAAPAGKDFQLWFDQPNRGMVSAGVMPHGAADTVTILLEGDAATATGAGITEEPAGGSTAPTGEPIALFAFT
ncbi:Putative zinc-finger [Pedococcus dokdonensis]|uniref:Regulator of SigK n=1 Tax=Pedococcus dokdonensis TaxID=443156 RepID=A0A1H0T342_9MICO|nr:anti-sigma factor [Pedococcus dokdonensis]SDP47968.1 Putative zinc-finger [Pedococcus dokdonensis]